MCYITTANYWDNIKNELYQFKILYHSMCKVKCKKDVKQLIRSRTNVSPRTNNTTIKVKDVLIEHHESNYKPKVN